MVLVGARVTAAAIPVAVSVVLAACGLSTVGSLVEPDGSPPGLTDGGVLPDGAPARGDASDGVDGAVDASCTTCDGGSCGAMEVLCGSTCCRGLCAQGVCKSPAFWVRGDDATPGATFVWPDRSANGHDATQATTNLKPMVLANAVNGHKAVRFANSARLLVADANAFKPGTGDVVWFHVSRNLGSNSADKNQVFGTLLDVDPFSGITAGYDSNNRPYGMYRATNDIFVKSGTGSLNEWVVMDGRRTGGSAEVRRNGASVATGAANVNVNGGQIVVGSERATGTEFLNGDIAEIILFATAFTDGERASVAQQLGALYGVTVQ